MSLFNSKKQTNNQTLTREKKTFLTNTVTKHSGLQMMK